MEKRNKYGDALKVMSQRIENRIDRRQNKPLALAGNSNRYIFLIKGNKTMKETFKDRQPGENSLNLPYRAGTVLPSRFYAALFIVFILILGMTIPVQTAGAATSLYYMPSKSNCGRITYNTTQYVALVGTSGSCNHADTFRKSYNGYMDILVGYRSGAYVSDMFITGQGSGNNLILKSRTGAGTAYIKLIEANPSNGSTIQVLDEMTIAVPSGQTVTVNDISSLSGLARAGNSFGILLGMDINGEAEIVWGKSTITSEQEFFTVDEGSPPDPTAPVVGTVSPSNTDSGTHVDAAFDLSATVSDPDTTVTSCSYCVTADGTCDTEWAPATLSGSSPNWTCTKTGISGFADGASLTMNILGISSGGPGEGIPENRTMDILAPVDGTFSADPGIGQITLTWTAASESGSGLADYKLVSVTGTTPPSDCSGPALYQGAALSYDDTGLSNGQFYAYRLCTLDNLGYMSLGVTAVTTPVSDTNKTIINGTLAKPGSHKITVSAPYSKDDNGNNELIVSYRVSGGGGWTPECDFTGYHLSSPYVCLIENLTNGQAYDVQIDWTDPDGLYGTDPEQYTVTPQRAIVMHNSENMASTKWAGDGGWGVPGGKYGEFTCGTCHTPRSPNIKKVVTSISISGLPGNGHVIVFDRTSGNPGDSGVMGDDSRVDKSQSSNICEVCHTYDAAQNNGVNKHAYNMSLPGDSSHFNGLDCVACHLHEEAFKATGDCYTCHEFEMGNVRRQVTGSGGDFEKTFHHVNDGSSLDIVTAAACEVCHGDLRTDKLHPVGDPLPADPLVELVDQDDGSYMTYDGTGSTLETFCTGCHNPAGSAINGMTPFSSATGGVDTNSAVDIGWTPGAMAHSYGNGSADGCQMCHGNSAAADTTLDPKTNIHGSESMFLLRYNNFTPGAGKDFCYNCHDGSVSSIDIQAAFSETFNHTGAGDDCQQCHAQHRAESGRHAAGSINPADMIGGVNRGMGFDYQYEVCFQCHSDAISKTQFTSELELDTIFGGGSSYQSNWNTIPDIESQYSTGNLAYHPILAAGKNQPANSLNSVWDSDNFRKDDSATGGPFNGMDNNFVDGWVSNSLVTCGDCHDNSGSGARGPHGSGQPWIIRGMNKSTAIKVTTAGAGTIYPNQTAPNENYINGNYCLNCHRADVYGWGSKQDKPSINNEDFSRIGHLGGTANTACQATNIESTKGGYRNIGCMNCHGGGEVGGIHGSNLGVGTKGTAQLGKRFMNGNARSGYTDSGSEVTCYTGDPPAIGTSLSSCSQHTNGTNNSATYYTY